MKYAFVAASHFLKHADRRENIRRDESTCLDENEKARLDALKTDLGIRADQMVDWNAFAKAIRGRTSEVFEPQATAFGTYRNSQPTATVALDLAFVQLEQYLFTLAMMRRGLRKLYAVLTPRQRLKADRLLPGHCLPLIGSGCGGRREDQAIH